MTFRLFGIRITIARHPRPKLGPPRPFDGKSTEEASGEFWSAFSIAGTLVHQCNCGRTHFCVNTTLDYEDGELERLLEKAAFYPYRYVPDHQNDSVGVIDIAGRQFTWGCPCHGVAAYERFIWEYRREILRYLNKRIATDAAEANELLSQVPEEVHA